MQMWCVAQGGLDAYLIYVSEPEITRSTQQTIHLHLQCSGSFSSNNQISIGRSISTHSNGLPFVVLKTEDNSSAKVPDCAPDGMDWWGKATPASWPAYFTSNSYISRVKSFVSCLASTAMHYRTRNIPLPMVPVEYELILPPTNMDLAIPRMILPRCTRSLEHLYSRRQLVPPVLALRLQRQCYPSPRPSPS